MINNARQTAGAIHIYMMELEELLKAIESVERAMNAFRTLNIHIPDTTAKKSPSVEVNLYGDILDMLKEKKDLNEQRLVSLKEKLSREME